MSEEEIHSWIKEKILNFHEKFYSADLMSLTIIDNSPIADIQAMVEEFFRILPKRRSLDRITTDGKLVLPYTKDLLGKVVKYKTSSRNQISIVYDVGDVLQKFEDKPLQFFLYLLHDNNDYSFNGFLR